MPEKTTKKEIDKQQEASRRFLEYHHFVEVIAFRSAPCRSLQEDIVQDVFVEFVSCANQLQLGEDLCPLLARMTQITALRHWREYIRHSPGNIAQIANELQIRMAHAIDDTSREILEDQLVALRHCVSKLGDKSRKLLEAFYIQGDTFAAIAESSSQKETTLRKAMCRIRASLRECIQRFLGKGGIS